MKLTNGDIWNARGALQKLAQIPMPAKVSWQVARLAGKANGELALIERIRVGLVNKYGVPNDQGQAAVPPNTPQFASFVKEFEELMAQEIELDGAVISLPGSLEIEPSALMALEKFVDIGE